MPLTVSRTAWDVPAWRPFAALPSRRPAEPWRFPTAQGVVRVAPLADVESEPVFAQVFAHCRKDGRYYSLVERTIEGFEHRAFVFEDHAGRVRAIQPFFRLDQDVLAGSGAWARALVAQARRVVPKFLTVGTLMVGCAAGEGQLAFPAGEEAIWIAESLPAALLDYARHVGVGMAVLKDFPCAYRRLLARFTTSGYARVPSMPATRLDIRYASFDDYLKKALSKATRKDLRRKFRRIAAAEPIRLEVTSDASPYVDELYPLYLQVYERSHLHFEKLTKAYLAAIGQSMPD